MSHTGQQGPANTESLRPEFPGTVIVVAEGVRRRRRGILSRNLKDYAKSKIAVMTPEHYLKTTLA